MAEPIYPHGYLHLRDVFSGSLPDKPRGLIDSDNVPASAFFYKHVVLRDVDVPSDLFWSVSAEGHWTIQIRESDAPDAAVLFDQSVKWGVQIVGEVGILAQWFPLYSGKFKTRIVNGQPVPMVLEPQDPPLVASVAPQPENPGPPILFDEKTTTIKVKMPALPERATSFTLRAAAGLVQVPVPEDFVDIAADLHEGDVVQVQADSVGETDIEHVWVRLRAVGPGGVYDGAAYHDAWNEVGFVDGHIAQVKGYEGWRFADDERATPYFETTAYDINRQDVTGSFRLNVGTDWISPAYRCSIPVGAYLHIESDYWVGRISGDNIYYAISVKPGQTSFDLIRDARSGQTFVLYQRGSDVRCARWRRLDSFQTSESDPVVAKSAIRWRALRHGAQTWCLVETGTGLYMVPSYNEGLQWEDAMALDGAMQLLASTLSEDGGTLYAVGKATAENLPNGIANGALMRVVATLGRADEAAPTWKVKTKGPLTGVTPEPPTAVSKLSVAGSTFTWGYESSGVVALLRSHDECATWEVAA